MTGGEDVVSVRARPYTRGSRDVNYLAYKGRD